MYVLGYSGLDGYLDIKNKYLHSNDPHENLVHQGMDAAAALIKDGQIVFAAAEERFTGKKHTGDFPINAINAALAFAGITYSDIEVIVHGFDYAPYQALYQGSNYQKELYQQVLSPEAQQARIKKYTGHDLKFQACSHHRAHATYALTTSGFSEALVVVADGLGEVNSLSVFDRQHQLTFGPTASLGMFYAACTEYLGFFPNSDEYKVMGLAGFGNPATYRDLMADILTFDGQDIGVRHLFSGGSSVADQETYRHFKQYLSEHIFPERKPTEPIQACHKDFAAALQERLNQVLLAFLTAYQGEHRNLCFVGGVALNCVATSFVAAHHLFDQIYVPPAAGDDGTAVGAALSVSRNQVDKPMPFYGPEIKGERVTPDLAKLARALIIDNKIVAWADGRMEFGPRALGHRSILANPQDRMMKERLNAVTKQREAFRPFAPIVKAEKASEYFEIDPVCCYKHMLINAPVKKEYQDRLQAITHVDGTARVQTVSRHELPLLWQLLDEVEKISGLPVLLNTSFNLKNQPIVCTREQARQAFLNSDIDILVINGQLESKDALS